MRAYSTGLLKASFLNKTTLDKLSTSDEGNLLFDGKELKNIGNVEASITELWSGQQSVSAEITLLDDYANYDIIVSMIEPLEDYPTQQKFDFMLKGAESLTGGMAENNTYIASYRLNNWNGTSVYFRRDNNPSSWNITLKKIWGIKFVSQQHEYSEEEKVIGKWIDGKPIYEKVISGTMIGSPADWTNFYDCSSLNIDNMISIKGFFNYNNERNIYIDSRYSAFSYAYNTKFIQYYNTEFPSRNYDTTLIIQYTKTTD